MSVGADRHGAPARVVEGASHLAWSTILLVLHWIGIVATTLAAGFGVAVFLIMVVFGGDLALAADTGAFAIGVGAVLALAGDIALLTMTIKGRHAARQGRPRTLFWTAATAALLGGLCLLGLLATIPWTALEGTGEAVLAGALLLLTGSYTVVAVRLALVTRGGAVSVPAGVPER